MCTIVFSWGWNFLWIRGNGCRSIMSIGFKWRFIKFRHYFYEYPEFYSCTTPYWFLSIFKNCLQLEGRSFVHAIENIEMLVILNYLILKSIYISLLLFSILYLSFMFNNSVTVRHYIFVSRFCIRYKIYVISRSHYKNLNELHSSILFLEE